jgi:CHRD domain
MVFLCSNLGNGPAGTQACPAAPAEITGTIHPADIIGPTGQGVSAGEFDEFLEAIESGTAYVNVHSSKYPGGEIRAQLDHEHN